jgi:hypothetical protein
MSEFSRRSVLGEVAAGSMLAGAVTMEGLSQRQPPSGPTPAQLTGGELPSFRFALGAVARKSYDAFSFRRTVSHFARTRAARPTGQSSARTIALTAPTATGNARHQKPAK